MCGICGIYGIEDRAMIQRMLAVLKHRGPDDEGVYTDTNISLGHARLSIIDLTEKGRQPMSSEDGNVWLSVNGEIYNFKELRIDLEKKGHRFHSDSDSESIIHSYEEYDLEFLNRLRGMFALALYDRQKKKLILARDPIGKKPLYYYHDNQSFIFASEIKAILAAGVCKDIEQEALFSYLAYQYVLGEKTLFKGIKKVLPGTALILDSDGLKSQRYWHIEENPIQADSDCFISELRKLLEESTALRMVADVPVGAFLSGGIDSAAIVALAKPHVSYEFHTFSVGFETFSELDSARAVSHYMGTVHHEINVTAAMVANEVSRIAWYYDEPMGDAAIINNYYLSREARKHVKVVVAGEGGDELFAGYSTYKKGLRYYDLFKLPLTFRKTADALINLIPDKGSISTIGNRIHKFAGHFTQPTLEKAHLYNTRLMSNAEIKSLTGLDFPFIDEKAVIPPNITDPLNRMLATDCYNLLPEKYLMKADKGTMANSVEERLPLLDKEIIKFAFSVPARLKIRNGQEKFILRRAVSDLLPERILNQPKQGFGTPLTDWLKKDMKKIASTKLAKGRFTNDFFKKDKINILLEGLEGGPVYRPKIIWTLLALELWYEAHWEGQR